MRGSQSKDGEGVATVDCARSANHACASQMHVKTAEKLTTSCRAKLAVTIEDSLMIHRAEHINLFVEESDLLHTALPLQPLDSKCLPVSSFIGYHADGGKCSLADLLVLRLDKASSHGKFGKRSCSPIYGHLTGQKSFELLLIPLIQSTSVTDSWQCSKRGQLRSVQDSKENENDRCSRISSHAESPLYALRWHLRSCASSCRPA